MATSINVKSREEFNNLLIGRDIKISQAVVEGILANLNTKKRFIHVIEIYLEEEDIIMDLTVERSDFVSTLEKNMEIHEENELYEECAEILKALKSLKSN